MINETATIIGKNIKRLRELKKWSQHDLASKIGGSFQQISKYERGENAPGSKKLNQLAELFGVEVSELTKKYDPSLKCSEPRMPYGDLANLDIDKLMQALPAPMQEVVKRGLKLNLPGLYKFTGRALEVLEEMETEEKEKKNK